MKNTEKFLDINNFYDGETYENLFIAFTNNLFEKAEHYDYIVLATRRCYCLVSAIYNKMKNKNELYKAELWKKFITSQAVEIDFTEKHIGSFLLVDDIMIHGSTVYDIYQKLSERYPFASIDTFVMIRNAEFVDKYIQKTQKQYDYLFLLKETDWSPVSKNIGEYVHASNVLHTSYVYDFTYDLKSTLNDFDSSLSKKLKKLNFREMNISHFEIENKIAEDFFEKYRSNFKVWSYNKNSIESPYKIFIREYHFEKIVKLVPYIEIEYIKKELVKNLWKYLEEKDNKFKKITSLSDMYKAVTAIIGIKIGKRLESEGLVVDINYEIDKSYYYGFCNDVIKLDYSFEDIFSNLTNSDNHLSFKDINIQNTNISAGESLFRRIMENSDTTDETRYEIMPQSTILQELVVDNKNDRAFDEFYSTKLLLMDSGKISANPLPVNYFEKNKKIKLKKSCKCEDYIWLSLKVGELSYFLPREYDLFAFLIAVKFFDDSNVENKIVSEDAIIDFIKLMESTKQKETLISNTGYFLMQIKNKKIKGIFNKYKVFVKALSMSEKRELSAIYSLLF